MTLSTIPKTQTAPPIIDLTDSLPDITANLIYDHPELNQLPPNIFEDAVFKALNDLIDEFAQNPDRYLKPHHETQLEQIATEYLEA